MIDPNKEKNSLKESGKILVTLMVIFIVFLIVMHNTKSNNDSATTAPVKKVCWHCGKDLTNDMNYIETDPGKYECTPCYEATMKGIHDEMKAEGYYQDREYEK
jgi:predicted amidophosphoribosyltransferase